MSSKGERGWTDTTSQFIDSLQRGDLEGGLLGPAEFPVGQQLGSVQFGPIQNQAQSPPRQVSFQDLKQFNSNHRLMLVILRMKVRRGMVIEKHANKNAEELADGLAFLD